MSLLHPNPTKRQNKTSLEAFCTLHFEVSVVATLRVNQADFSTNSVSGWRYGTERETRRSAHALDTAELNREEANNSRTITKERMSSRQNHKGVCQHLKLILHTFQSSLDLQGVVQDFDSASVRIKADREGTLDASYVSPGDSLGHKQGVKCKT